MRGFAYKPAAQEMDTKNPILHILVVGFHHKKGCQVRVQLQREALCGLQEEDDSFGLHNMLDCSPKIYFLKKGFNGTGPLMRFNFLGGVFLPSSDSGVGRKTRMPFWMEVSTNVGPPGWIS